MFVYIYNICLSLNVFFILQRQNKDIEDNLGDDIVLLNLSAYQHNYNINNNNDNKVY